MASLADLPTLTSRDVARGVCRLLHRQGFACLFEVPLGNGRRADVVGIDAAGRLTLVEIKVSMADLRSDLKWGDYLDYCDRFFWAVPEGFDLSPFDTPAFRPERAGLLIADRYEAAVLREAPWVVLNAARRKAETLRFARRAASRVASALDPLLDAEI